ncbi:hypothetical protein Tco_0094155, partial [Tanacetum coccineum]
DSLPKGKPNLGLWYPRESPLHLEAFSDSDYGGSNLDRKSTTGGCQLLDFQEEVSTGYAEEVSTGYAEGVNTGSIKVCTISGQVSTDSIKKSIPSPDKGQREGKAPMLGKYCKQT